MTAPADFRQPLSVGQVAQRWGCSEGLVRKLIRNGQLRCFRPGTLIRIAAAEVERFECQQQTTNTQCSASEADMRSSTSRMGSGSDDSLRPRIGRAPRRKRGVSGLSETAVIHGPWAG